ncbi:MAG: flagellin, partial [Ilumatobacteraceae bacterium]|nr:flagellin [Ilumatobacteraceae bacterium]
MRINQNVMANNASRNLSNTNVMLGKSLEKLSSGFRINRAADDAAGLVVSQGLRAQVSGLKQATRNAQDGISVVQTAEGALNEVHTMLTRMRDLSVQAANTGGNDLASRTAAQAEINQLATEITRTSTDTKFGGVALLDGSYGATAGQLSSFDPNGSLTFAAGNTINVNVTGGSGAVSVSLQAGTFTGASAAASIESSVKAALNATGNAVDKAAAASFHATFDAVGAGGAFTLSNGSSAAIAVTDGTGTPLAAGTNGLGGLVGTVAAATGSGGNFQIGANSGQVVSLAITDSSATALGVSALNVTT